MRRFLIAGLLFAVARTVGAESEAIDGVAATVNDDVITFTQVRERTDAIEEQLRLQHSDEALTAKIKEVRLRAVNDLIDRQLKIQEFRKLKASIPPQAVNDRITAIIRDQFGGDRSEFLKRIAAQGFTYERFRQMEEERIIIGAMASREVKGEPMVPKSRVEAYYNEHRLEWTMNDEVKLRMIKILPDDAPAKKLKMLQKIRDKIEAGSDFGEMARLYSEDSTQDNGGEWGWVKRGELSPVLERTVFDLQKGKVSEVMTLTLNGATAHYVFLVEDRKAGVAKPFKDLEPQIEQLLIRQERQKMEAGWVERLRKKAYIKIY